MFNIFKALEKTRINNDSSRLHAQSYLDKLVISVAVLKDVYDKAHSGAEVRKLNSDDCIVETATIEINGELISFKMAFNCGSESPYAVEIIDKKGLEER